MRKMMRSKRKSQIMICRSQFPGFPHLILLLLLIFIFFVISILL